MSVKFEVEEVDKNKIGIKNVESQSNAIILFVFGHVGKLLFG